MKRKIIVSLLVVSCLMASVFSITSMAKNHHGKGNKSGDSYAVCTTKDCTKDDTHTHDGKYYEAHSPKDGHDYHETTSHTHGNASERGHESGGGHNRHTKSY